MTGSINGIITFAYAIVLTVIFYANGLANAGNDLERSKRQPEREGASLKLKKKLLENCRPMIHKEFMPGFDLCLSEAYDSVSFLC